MQKNDIIQNAPAAEQTALWYLGQVGFVFGSGGGYIAVDPYLSDYVDKNCSQLVEWKRLYAPPISAGELDFLDAVLCTHSHYDHADPWTLPAIAAANKNTVFVVPAPEVDTIAAYGIDKSRILPAYADCPLTLGGFTVTPIPSAHEVFHLDEAGNYHELGYILENGDTRIFHAGDMCPYEGLTHRLTDMDIAILPVNGRDAKRNALDIIGNFNSAEAVTLAREIRADLLVPVHHDLYEVNRVDTAVFVDAVHTLNPTQQYHIFAPGERLVYTK